MTNINTGRMLPIFIILSILSILGNGQHSWAIEPRHGTTSETVVTSPELTSWMQSEAKRSAAEIIQNISPAGTAIGTVVASPSRNSPNYYFHWIRDAAITMAVINQLYVTSQTDDEKNHYASKMFQYATFSRQNQLTPNRSQALGDQRLGDQRLGEPKFYVDGTAFNDDWGRPQNDGPALRAITLISYANTLLNEGKSESWIRSFLYDGRLPTNSVIKADLEYIAYNWIYTSVDLWEEVRGMHFFTEMVQRKALIVGANLADRLNDQQAASWYRYQAKLMEPVVEHHWDSIRGYILATYGQERGSINKDSGLDSAVILGVLHGNAEDGFYSPIHEKVLLTAVRIRESFQKLYAINNNKVPNLGTAIGRYPEDVYNGYTVGQQSGNPWFLSTLAYAEFYNRAALEWKKKGTIEITNINLAFFKTLPSLASNGIQFKPGQVIRKGSVEFSIIIQSLQQEAINFFNRVKYHASSDGSLSEQMNRWTGFMQGAPNLTWSYGSFLTAYWQKLATENTSFRLPVNLDALLTKQLWGERYSIGAMMAR